MVQMEHYGIREWFSNGQMEQIVVLEWNIMVLGSGSRIVQMERYVNPSNYGITVTPSNW